ncbi:MAG: hypothetical protein AAFP76_14670 [Bacteroidota bacterium]
MRQKLSSRWTFVFKFVVPVIFLAQVILLIPIVFRDEMNVFGVFFFCVAIGLFGYMAIKIYSQLKVVSIDNQYLYVSNFNEEIKVPLVRIEKVTEWVLFRPRVIKIHLNGASGFGEKIIFIGTREFFLFFNTHPSVTEIRRRVRNAKNDIQSLSGQNEGS